jgi:hypothetical protein
LSSPLVHGDPIAIKPGTVEGRVQTSSSFWSSNLYYGAFSPGIHYWIEAELFILNLQGGFAYFFSPNAALGANLSFTAAGGGGSIIMFGAAPFFKYVHKSFFIEPGLGISILSGSGGGDALSLFQADLWTGGQIAITESTAFLVGPYFSYLYNLDASDGTGVAGLRLGISFFRF